MDISQALYNVAVSFIPLMLGIILHEVAHGYAAYLCGDNTAKQLGRLTLNPVPHIDPVGTAFFVLTAIASPFVFGWAKPVPVNARNFTNIKNAKKGMMLVSLAGPMTNFVLAIVFLLLLKISISILSSEFLLSSAGVFLQEMLFNGVGINLILMIINLLPIPPLDGSHVVANFLPYPYDYRYMSIAKYGMMILMLLLVTDVIGFIIKSFLNVVVPIIVRFLG